MSTVNTGFTTVQGAFEEVKHDMNSLMNTLLNEIGELRKDILKVCLLIPVIVLLGCFVALVVVMLEWLLAIGLPYIATYWLSKPKTLLIGMLKNEDSQTCVTKNIYCGQIELDKKW